MFLLKSLVRNCFLRLTAPRIVALRKQRSLTQQALADSVGIHVSNIRRHEAGTSQPTLDVLRNLALALATSADSLLFDEDERGPDDDLRLGFEAKPPAPSTATRKKPSKPSSKASSSATTPAAGPTPRSGTRWRHLTGPEAAQRSAE